MKTQTEHTVNIPRSKILIGRGRFLRPNERSSARCCPPVVETMFTLFTLVATIVTECLKIPAVSLSTADKVEVYGIANIYLWLSLSGCLFADTFDTPV